MSLLDNSAVIPDILLGFSTTQPDKKHQYLIAVEYDAGTENPQYFGRDKVKKYADALHTGHPLFSNQNLRVIVFADSRKRILQLIRHSMKFLDSCMGFLFGALDDLRFKEDFFAEIYIDPFRNKTPEENVLCSFLQ